MRGSWRGRRGRQNPLSRFAKILPFWGRWPGGPEGVTPPANEAAGPPIETAVSRGQDRGAIIQKASMPVRAGAARVIDPNTIKGLYSY
jgi:hypothetical protein